MNRQAVVFAVIVALIVGLLYVLIVALKLPPIQLVLALIVVAALAVLSPNYQIFKEYERGVFFRLGRFLRVSGPGATIFFPVFETFELVDLRTQVLDIPPQDVVTKENIKIKIDATTYIKIVDPRKSITEIKDYKKAISELLTSQIRTVIGRTELESLLEKTEDLNANLYDVLKQAAEAWGIQVLRVEIKTIDLPPELVSAYRRKQEALEQKARLETEAQARTITIKALKEITNDLNDKTLAYMYLEALKKISEGKSNKILFPLELTKLASALSVQLSEQGEAVDAKTISSVLGALLKKHK